MTSHSPNYLRPGFTGPVFRSLAAYLIRNPTRNGTTACGRQVARKGMTDTPECLECQRAIRPYREPPQDAPEVVEARLARQSPYGGYPLRRPPKGF